MRSDQNLLLYRRRRRNMMSAAPAFLAANGPFGMVLDFSDASVAIDDAADLLDFTSQGQVSGGSLVGPGARLTYSAQSPKLTEQADGVLRFQAHNLYLNSEAPANQSVTLIAGASYAITITGSVSMVASGAASGTWAAGTINFTAATGTLTLGSTTGTGTVHLRRTPSQPDYIRTTSAAAFGLPYVWSGGVRQGIVVEPSATNLYLDNLNPITRNITVGAGAHTLSFRGTGSVTLSGVATGTLNGTGANNRVRLTVTATAGTLTVTPSGSVTLVQVETGSVATSEIITYGAAVARAADNGLSVLASVFPYDVTNQTWFAEVEAASGFTASGTRIIGQTGSWTPLFFNSNIQVASFYAAGSAVRAITSVAGRNTKVASSYSSATGSRVTADGLVPGTNASTAHATPTTINIGSGASTVITCVYKRVAYFPRVFSDAELQAITS